MIRRIARAELPHAPLSLSASKLQSELSPRAASHTASASVAAALRALLDEELVLKPGHIRSVVERELTRVRRARAVRLHVHPQDAALLDQCAAYVQRLELRGVLEVIEDDSLTRGGCLVHSNLGEVDARLETRLAAALELLTSGGFDEP